MQPIDIEKIESVVEPVVRSKGYELVACEWLFEEGRRILRVFIDKNEGVNIDDCSEISYLLSPLFDVEDLIPGNYSLEISSPGLDRPLKKMADFEKFAGNKIRLRTKTPMNGRGNFKGILQGVDGNEVLVKVDQQIFRIPHPNIHKARVDVDWDEFLKKKK